MERTVHLQGIGRKPGKPAGELRPGDVVMWNYGYKSTTLFVVPSKTGKTVTAVLYEHSTGKSAERKLGADRLVAIA